MEGGCRNSTVSSSTSKSTSLSVSELLKGDNEDECVVDGERNAHVSDDLGQELLVRVEKYYNKTGACSQENHSSSIIHNNDSNHQITNNSSVFTKLIESEKIINNYHGYDDDDEDLEEDLELGLDDEDLNGELVNMVNTNKSPSPQPQPDLLIHIQQQQSLDHDSLQQELFQSSVMHPSFQFDEDFDNQQQQQHLQNLQTLSSTSVVTTKQRKQKVKQSSVEELNSVATASSESSSKMTLNSSRISSMSERNKQQLVTTEETTSMAVTNDTKKKIKKGVEDTRSNNDKIQELNEVGATKTEEITGVQVENEEEASSLASAGNINNKKRKSKKSNKSEHISVDELIDDDDDEVHEPKNDEYEAGAKQAKNNNSSDFSNNSNNHQNKINTGSISISKLKSIYSSSNETVVVENNISSNGCSNSSAVNQNKKLSAAAAAAANEQRVFAKVSVAHLRRSFGDLTNLNTFDLTTNDQQQHNHRSRFRSSSATGGYGDNNLSLTTTTAYKNQTTVVGNESGGSVVVQKLSANSFHPAWLPFNNHNSKQQSDSMITTTNTSPINYYSQHNNQKWTFLEVGNGNGIKASEDVNNVDGARKKRSTDNITAAVTKMNWLSRRNESSSNSGSTDISNTGNRSSNIIDNNKRPDDLIDILIDLSSIKSSFSKFDELARKSNMNSSSGGGGDLPSPNNSNNLSRSASSTATQNGSLLEKKFCRSCEKQVFQMEMIKAEKSQWHRNCFRCSQCNKTLSVDTYSSHEGELYCKPHFKELFQPKAVFENINTDEVEGEYESDGKPVNSTALANKHRQVTIVWESQPTELPPDVVRGSEKSTGLEDLQQVDVRSKFELFEKQTAESLKSPSPTDIQHHVTVKRSASVLAKLARYQNGGGRGMDIGVPDDALNGDNNHLHGGLNEDDQSTSSNEDEIVDENHADYNPDSKNKKKLKSPAAALSEIMQLKAVEEVRSRWEVGMGSRKEELNEQRKEELAKFRSRLCHGKSNQLKEMYEKAVTESEEPKSSKMSELEELGLEKATRLRNMFETGHVFNQEDEEFEENSVDGAAGDSNQHNSKQIIDRDVFESPVAKQSRSLFKQLDQSVVKSGSFIAPVAFQQQAAAAANNKSSNQTSPTQNATIKQNCGSDELVERRDIIRCSDKIEEDVVIKTEELSNKFKFFETYQQEELARAQNKKPAFRITPPRDTSQTLQKSEDSVDVGEVYRDPMVVRSEDGGKVVTEETDSILMNTKTASKMLNVFRQLEEKSNDGSQQQFAPRPLKQFTPPREPSGSNGAGGGFNSDSESDAPPDEFDDEEDAEDETQEEENILNQTSAQKIAHDEFLKEVGSLARARSLRAKFERWEQQENLKNSQHQSNQQIDLTSTLTTNEGLVLRRQAAEDNNRVGEGEAEDDHQQHSIESAKNLRAKFEAHLNQQQLLTSNNCSTTTTLLSSSNSIRKGQQPIGSVAAVGQQQQHKQVRVNRFVELQNQQFDYEQGGQPGSLTSSGMSENCDMCQKKVYVMEKVEAGGKIYHKNCFRCSQCKCILRMDTFTSNKGTLFCTPHFKQLFKIKGNYDEGFGHETQKQIWAKKQAAKLGQGGTQSSGAEKEN